MEPLPSARRKYRFGLFEADSASGELLRQGVRVRLQDQPFRLLAILLENTGEVVSHEELRHQLWPADTFVEFDGSLKAALKRLRAALGDSADNPVFIETVPKRGYRFIAPVAVESTESGKAAPPPLVRFGSLNNARAAAGHALPPSRRGRSLTYALAVIAVLTGLTWLMFRHPSTKPARSSGVVQAAIPVRKSVAVLGFHNVSAHSDDDWLATALSEMLSTELGSGEKVRIVSGEEVANLRLTSPWPQVGTLGRQTASRIGTSLNSDMLVLGAYTTIGEGKRAQLRLDVSLQDANSGDVLAQVAETGNRDDLFRVTSEVGAKLRVQLGVAAVTDAEEPALLASMPDSPGADRFYSLGIAKLRDFDARAAKDLLQQAVAAEPKFPLAHAALAGAWGQLGYEQKRKEEAKTALDLSGNLPQLEKLQVEGDYYESLPDHEKAASAYSALFELFPDNLDYGLQLAYAQYLAAHGTEAAATIARLRHLPAPASQDPRIDIAEAHALPFDRRPEALTLLHTAETKANSQGKKIIYARARREECMDLIYGEHPDQADAPCKDAYNIYLAAGNNLGAADALRLLGDQQGGQGHVTQAMAMYERALKILGDQGELLKTATILNNMANGYVNEGNLARGEQLFQEARLDFEKAGDRGNAAVALVNIADITYLRGNLAEAAKIYEQVIEIDTSTEGALASYPMQRLGDLELAQGRVHEAHQIVTKSVESLHGVKTADEAASLAELGDVLRSEGDLPGARQQYQSALDLQKTLGRNLDVAETQEALAELDLDDGHPDQAEALLRQALAVFEKEKPGPDAISTYTLLSRVLLEEGKGGEARKAIQHAAELAHSSPAPSLILPIQIQTARLNLADSGAKASAIDLAHVTQQTRAAIASARKLGYYQLECDAQLVLAEVESKTDPAIARSHLETIEKETRDRGLILLANQAHAMLPATKS